MAEHSTGKSRKVCWREATGADDRCTFPAERAAEIYRTIGRLGMRLDSCAADFTAGRRDGGTMGGVSLTLDAARNVCEALGD